MFEEIAEMLMGPWGIAAVILVGAGMSGGNRRALRKMAKATVRVSYDVADLSSNAIGAAKEQFTGAVSGAKEQLSHVVSEAKAHRAGASKKSHKSAPRKARGEYDVEFS